MDNNFTNFLTWFSNHSGDIPTWIMAIFTPITVAIGFNQYRLQLIENKKQMADNTIQMEKNEQEMKRSAVIEENKFLLELDRRFMQKSNLEVSQKIYDELFHSKKYVIDGTNDADVSNYLSDLEFVCNLFLDKVLTKERLSRNSYDDQIKEAMQCPSIKNFIDAERIRTNKPQWFKILEDVAKIL